MILERHTNLFKIYMKNKTNVAVLVAVLALGVGIGLLIGYRAKHHQVVSNTSGMEHMMPDGTIMKGSDTHSGMAAMMAAMNAGLEGKTGDAFDQAFLAEMIVHHQGAIDMARLAQSNAKHQEIKTLADNIITAQINEIAQMKLWLKAWYNN